MPINLPTNLLRSFVAIVDAGSMLNAADQVFVTQSALSLQIKRLEELVQQPLFTREGRRLQLTSAGDMLLDYARRMLALHDEAITSVIHGQFTGPVRVGMVQDVAETLLSGLLARFADLHPDSQVYARVSATSELVDQLSRNQLDLVIGYAAVDDPSAISVAQMNWYGKAELARRDIVPLAVLERPCRFREAAIAALDAAGQPWRSTVETPNLTSLRAALDAPIGLTFRTHLFQTNTLEAPSAPLPPLPQVAFIVERSTESNAVTSRLAELATEIVRSL